MLVHVCMPVERELGWKDEKDRNRRIVLVRKHLGQPRQTVKANPRHHLTMSDLAVPGLFWVIIFCDHFCYYCRTTEIEG